MRDPIVIVGSGASGAHFARGALEKGRRVLMLDVGHRRPEPVSPEEDFLGLKAHLEDPVRYFLGSDFEGVILPGREGEYYGFPPSKEYVFRPVAGLAHRSEGFSPLLSFAAGGLGEAWNGGCYPYSDAELAEFPFGYEEIGPYYEEIARRIGISGELDDLVRFFPVQEHLLAPVDLDEHGRMILAAYEKKRARLNEDLRCYVGRARIATLTRDAGERRACSYLGRCLWGCPTDSIYLPSLTLAECRAHEGFEYRPGLRVSHFEPGEDGRIRSVVARGAEDGAVHEFEVGTLVLAAGTLCSAKIFLDSIYRDCGEVWELSGLIDNRQILMPFVNLKMVGRSYEAKSYQFQQLVIALDADDPMDYAQGLVTTLKTALFHPIVQSMPTSIGTALAAFRSIHAALGIVNINFSDRRREENLVTLETDGSPDTTSLLVRYRPEPEEERKLRRTIRVFQKVLRRLGCIAPSAMTHVRPMGASVHYAGTFPMCVEGGSRTVDENGRSRDFENLYFVDGSVFPSLPAKNLTFTLMANAARVADVAS